MIQNTVDIKVVRVQFYPKDSVIKAFVDVNVNDVFLIKGMRIVEGPKGLFVAMPQERGKNNRWYNTVDCLSGDMKITIRDCVLSAYHKFQPEFCPVKDGTKIRPKG